MIVEKENIEKALNLVDEIESTCLKYCPKPNEYWYDEDSYYNEFVELMDDTFTKLLSLCEDLGSYVQAIHDDMIKNNIKENLDE